MAKRILIVLTPILVICLTACVRNNPLFRRLAEKEDAKRIKQTDEQIAKSPKLQELDHLCTKQIPLFSGFVLNGRFAGPTWATSLSYYYRSPAQYAQVKTFYSDYFLHNGWSLARQKEDGWGPDEIEFRKTPYRIIISHGGLGDAEYAIGCDKLSDSGEPLPNASLDASGDCLFFKCSLPFIVDRRRAAASTLTLACFSIRFDTMKLRSSIITLFFLFCLVGVARAQDGCGFIDKTKALHFISFERLSGKNNSDVQLRLTNNSTCTIVLDTWEDPPKRPIAEIIKDSGVCKPSMFLELQDGQHVGMFYNIHFSGRNLTEHFGAGDDITAATLKSGRSILFDVPRKHFKDRGDLKIRFEYDWQICHVAQNKTVVLGAEISFFSWFLPKDVLK